MKVCIAEKPSVAKEIAAIIGAKERKDGYFEGNGFQVTWTFGHLCTLKEPHEYTPMWKSWRVDLLPMIPPRFGIKLIEDKGIHKQFHVIEKLMSKAEIVINCGDAGQEGELIQRWVMQKAQVKCPVLRLWISSLTDESIKEGFTSLQPQEKFNTLYEAGLSRAIGDWLLGMNATRLYTLKYGQNKQVLSIGRVQTPTLALIVKRQKEIDNFEPKQYFELKTLYRNVVFNSSKGKFDDRASGEMFLDQIRGHLLYIKSVTKKDGKEFAPKLYDLTSLQVDCNKKFGFSADDTLKLIQSLYEKKVTTYPRVDTTYLTDDIYPKCKDILSALSGYENYTSKLPAKLPKTKRVFDNSKVTDHHAIIPTNIKAINLSDYERKVYDLVVRRFIAVFYPDCLIATTTVLADVNNIEFKTSGKVILEPGWRVLFTKNGNKDSDNSDSENKEDDEERTLPNFVVGESGEHEPALQEKWTQPPKLYTEATLLRAMETAGKLVDDDSLREALKENGIGRPSTRAAIIETLFKRKYIKKEKKNLVATSTGIDLIDTINEELLKSAELTGIWENKLRKIEKGEYKASDFIIELKSMLNDVVNNVKQDNSNRQVSTQEDLKSVLTKKSKQKKTTEKRAKPDKSLKSDLENKSKQRQNVNNNFPGVNNKCPKCGVGTIIKGKTAFGCSEWRNGCDYKVLFSDIN